MPEKPDTHRRIHPRGRLRAWSATTSRRTGRARGYAELRCKSNFSFLQGASHPEELVEWASALGYSALAITDLNTLAGVVRMHCAAKACGLKLLIGAEIVPVDGPPLLLYAPDRAAYGRLARIITEGRLRSIKGECAVTVDDIARWSDGLIGAVVAVGRDEGIKARDQRIEGSRDRGKKSREATGRRSAGDYRVTSSSTRSPEIVQSIIRYRGIFADRLYLAVGVHGGPDDARGLAEMHALAEATVVPMLANNDVHYHSPDRRFLQDVLSCIREGCTLEEAGLLLFANAERHLKSIEEMHRLFADYPDAIARTLEVAERCTFRLDELRYEYPETLCPPDRVPSEFLADLTWSGARRRYPHGVPDKVRRLIEHELDLIGRLSYEPYFLTVWDIVKFARSRDILCQGRGSAANSVVCYCLGITSVDPDRVETLFERFVSAERNEPPDIDVDFEHERREEVFQYIYDKYGRDHAGIVAEVITYRPRSAVRDVGKALGLSLDRVDALAKKHDWWDFKPLQADCLREAGLDPGDTTVKLLGALVPQILGFPRHLSQHVGGFVITRGPLCEMVPIGNGAMPDRTFIEWDKDDIDALGILKVDCLALGMLTAIHKCFRLIRTEVLSPGRNCVVDAGTSVAGRVGGRFGQGMEGGWNGQEDVSRFDCMAEEYRFISDNVPSNGEAARCLARMVPSFVRPYVPASLTDVPPEDPAVYDMICRADTIGVFQIESRAQMSMLPRLRPRCYYDLVIEVAIVRPGPIQGGMVHPYLRRRAGQEPVAYPNDTIRRVLERTLGVPLFQEQAMQLAIVAAGFTAGEADQLRRAMAAWRRDGQIEKFRSKLVEGMQTRGLSKEFAERCFEQICGFGEYGFPESHAASFALLVYVSAWLKRYHPAAFCAAVLNSQPMGFYQPAQLVRDAREHGVTVLPIDVNCSGYDCRLERRCDEAAQRGERQSSREQGIDGSRGRETKESLDPDSPAMWGVFGPAVRLGMRLAKGISPAQVNGIEAAQGQGPFRSIADLAHRSGASRATLARLAAADAFRSLGMDRRQAVWKVLALGSDAEVSLFVGMEPVETRADLPELSTREVVLEDYNVTGLSLNAHPMSLIRAEMNQVQVQPNRALQAARQGTGIRVAGIVLVRQRPSTANGIIFCTIEDETGVANLIIRPAVYAKYRRAAGGAAAIIVDGRVERAGDVVHVNAQCIRDATKGIAELRSLSRDFQ